MPKALADEKGNALKEATKRAAAKGITPPKHEPVMASGIQVPELEDSRNPYGTTGGAFNPFALGQLTGQGLDIKQRRVVESKHVGNGTGATLTHRMENTMTQDTNVSEAQATKEAAAKQKIEAKAAKTKAAEDKKAIAAQAKIDKATIAAQAKIDKAHAAAEAKALKDAEKANAEPKAPRDRTYTGSMLSLADKVASGAYVKGANGQLRSGDALAVALEVVPAKQMVGLLLAILGFDENPYAHLNYGQQSMNLRNKLRGAIKAGAKIGEGDAGVVIDLARVTSHVQDLVAAQPA